MSGFDAKVDQPISWVVYALAVSLVCFSLIDVIAIYAYKVHQRVWTKTTSSAFGILNLFFQACVFFFIAVFAQSTVFNLEKPGHNEKSEQENVDTSHEARNGSGN
jgi:TRAP-type C4-dicarboxylate transport system permease small subunit